MLITFNKKSSGYYYLPELSKSRTDYAAIATGATAVVSALSLLRTASRARDFVKSFPFIMDKHKILNKPWSNAV